MSSREIAELTGKRHSDVMRDIRRTLEDLKLDERKFASVYEDAKGEVRPCFALPKRLVLNVCAGYSAPLRQRIIDRWLELEEEARQPVAAPVLTNEQKLAEAYLLATSVMQTQVAPSDLRAATSTAQAARSSATTCPSASA